MKTQPAQPLYVDSYEVADRLGVPVSTVNDWARRGVGPPSFRFGKHRRYREDELQAWVEAQREAS